MSSTWKHISDSFLLHWYKSARLLYVKDVQAGVRITKKGEPHKGDVARIEIGSRLIRMMEREIRGRGLIP